MLFVASKMGRVIALLLVALAASSCAPLISSHPSDMVLIEQESHTLAPSQVAELKGRLNAFASKHGLSFGINGSAGDGGVFAVEMKDQQEATSIIVTSPFKPTTFIFGLYSRLPATGLAPQRAMFASAVRVATAETPANTGTPYIIDVPENTGT